MTRLRDRPALLAALAAIGLRAALIAAYPALFGGDSVVRLANADRVLLSYQLPALQAAIHVLWGLWPSQWGPRALLVVVSGVAAAGFFRFASRLMPKAAALTAALLFALNPFLTAYSIAPYQEMLMLAGLAWAFAWAIEGREPAAAAALALACLTRYEAWLACPAVLWLSWRLGPRSPMRLIRLAALYGAAPLAWMLWNRGLTPAGSFALESQVSFERLWRWAYLGWITLQHAWFILPVAALGVWRFVRRRRWTEASWQSLLLFAGLFAVAILLSAHGERDQPDRYVTAREAHLPIAFVCLLAGLGVSTLRRGRLEITIAAVVLSLLSAQRFVASETAAPHVALAYRAAKLLNERMAPGETAVVLAKPVPADMLERFLDIAERQGGSRGRAEAQLTLLELHIEPPDYQRILVQTRFGRGRVLSLAPGRPEPAAPDPDWALLWWDFEPSSEQERAIRAGLEPDRLVATLLSPNGGSLLAYRLP